MFGTFIHFIYMSLCFIVIVALPLGIGAFSFTKWTQRIMERRGVNQEKTERICTFLLFFYSTILFLVFAWIVNWI